MTNVNSLQPFDKVGCAIYNQLDEKLKKFSMSQCSPDKVNLFKMIRHFNTYWDRLSDFSLNFMHFSLHITTIVLCCFGRSFRFGIISV